MNNLTPAPVLLAFQPAPAGHPRLRTAHNPLGIRLIGPVAGIAAGLDFVLFRGYRLPGTVSRETVTRVKS